MLECLGLAPLLLPVIMMMLISNDDKRPPSGVPQPRRLTRNFALGTLDTARRPRIALLCLSVFARSPQLVKNSTSISVL